MQKWFHANCQKITNEEYVKMQVVVWICTYCSNQQTEGRFELKLFKKIDIDNICPGCGQPEEYFKFADSLHNNYLA